MNNEQRIIFAGFAMACLMVVLGMVVSSQRPTVLPVFGNLAALMIAAIGIRKGILHERRSAFWLGTLFLALLVLSRFLEYETSPLLKSLAFIFCGTITFVAGVAYEKFLRRKEVAA
jgi:urea transporter